MASLLSSVTALAMVLVILVVKSSMAVKYSAYGPVVESSAVVV